MPAALDLLAGGWRVSAINTMRSGLPVNLNYTPSAAQQVSGAINYRRNVSGDVYVAEDQRSVNNYLSAAAVTVPTGVSQPFGNAARNSARGPALHTLGIGLHKSFNLPLGQSRMELRLEGFNVLNRSNFSTPNGNRSATNFGTITSLATTPRQLQLGVKFDF